MDILLLTISKNTLLRQRFGEAIVAIKQEKQLAAYLKVEGATEGYYVVFDHRQDPEPRREIETIDAVTVRSYVIPVVQERPSDERLRNA